MTYTNLDQYFQAADMKNRTPIGCVVVFPNDVQIIQAVVRAYKEQLINPILIGEKKIIEELLVKAGEKNNLFKIYNEKYSQAAIDLAIDMVYGGDADCIMKGHIETSEFMHEILKKENRFCEKSLVSMVSFRILPNYPKLVALTDTGICPHPTLEQKAEIIHNAVSAMQAMGVECPKVACVTAYNYADVKMPETIDAAALKQFNETGQLTGCIVDGPMTIDVALDREQAKRKGVKSSVAGNADIILFPDLTSASISSRMISLVTDRAPGILVVGTKVPVIIVSKNASEETKYLSIRIAVSSSVTPLREQGNAEKEGLQTEGRKTKFAG